MDDSVEWDRTRVLQRCGPLLEEDPQLNDFSEDFLRSFLKGSASTAFLGALEMLGPREGSLLVSNLLLIPSKEQDTLSEEDAKDRKCCKASVLALRALYNLISSQRVVDALQSIPLEKWRKLLRIYPIIVEVTACLSRIPQILYQHFPLHVEYGLLHEDMALLYTGLPVGSDRSFMTAFFLWFLREDVGYLAECKDTIDPNAFVSLLKIVDTILDVPTHGKALEVHYNSVRFVELYVEQLVQNAVTTDDEYVLEVLPPVLSIIANGLIYTPFTEGSYYDTDQTITLNTLCDLFEAICDMDAQRLLAELDGQGERSRKEGEPARPSPSKPFRRPNLSETVEDLTDFLEEVPSEELAELRTHLLKALGALAEKKEKYAEEMAKRRLVPLVLSCARVTADSPFQMQHAITTLSMMCKHRRNQEILFEVEQTPSGAIDHEKLLAELGMRAVVDEASGKLKLEKL